MYNITYVPGTVVTVFWWNFKKAKVIKYELLFSTTRRIELITSMETYELTSLASAKAGYCSSYLKSRLS